jgi:hypothetical protein
LTGKPVYEGDTVMARLMAHREGAIPSLRDAIPEVHERLNQVFAKMLAKRPEDRYQSMTDVIAVLEACLDSGPSAVDQASEAPVPARSPSVSSRAAESVAEGRQGFESLPPATEQVDLPLSASTIRIVAPNNGADDNPTTEDNPSATIADQTDCGRRRDGD